MLRGVRGQIGNWYKLRNEAKHLSSYSLAVKPNIETETSLAYAGWNSNPATFSKPILHIKTNQNGNNRVQHIGSAKEEIEGARQKEKDVSFRTDPRYSDICIEGMKQKAPLWQAGL